MNIKSLSPNKKKNNHFPYFQTHFEQAIVAIDRSIKKKLPLFLMWTNFELSFLSCN